MKVVNQFNIIIKTVVSFLLLTSVLLQMYPASELGSNESVFIESRDYWPTSGWRKSTPEEQGMNSTKLCQISEYIGDNPAIDSILIIRGGYIV